MCTMITATWRLLLPINRKQFNPLNLSSIREFASVQDFTTSKPKHGAEKNSLPLKPKKALNPFLLYCATVRNKLQEEYPHCKPNEILKKMSEKWAQVDPITKQNFQKQFYEQTSIYKQKLMDYENSLTNEQKMEIIKELQEKGHTSKSKINQKLSELGKPKRPSSAFILFLHNKRNTKDPQVLYKEWFNNVTHEWKNMTMEAKNKYNTQASNLLEKYKSEMKKWEEDMIQAGHYNFVKSNVKHKLETHKHEK